MTDGTPTDSEDGSLDPATQRAEVRKRYGSIAASSSSCCGDTGSSTPSATERSKAVGYADADLKAVEADGNLGLGCGNPTAIASLEPGDVVLDLGSGGGFDCFLAAREVGETGRVVGVDMTPEMVETARENAAANDATNVEFRLGEIEHLPVADESVDVVISNCVVNLSPDKRRVFRDAYHVLRPGGRLAISDIVAPGGLPEAIRGDSDAVSACVGGASSPTALQEYLTDAGFTDVAIEPKRDEVDWDQLGGGDGNASVVSATIEARKPEPEPETEPESA